MAGPEEFSAWQWIVTRRKNRLTTRKGDKIFLALCQEQCYTILGIKNIQLKEEMDYEKKREDERSVLTE